MDAYDIKTMIEEDVRCDIHGDLYGHERVAERLAEQFKSLKDENESLEREVKYLEEMIINRGR